MRAGPFHRKTLQRLRDCIDRDGFRLDIISDIEEKRNIADVLAKSQKIQLGKKEMRREPAK